MKTVTTRTYTLDLLKPEGWCCLKLHLNANQSQNCPRADHILLPGHYKTIHYLLWGGSDSLQGISPLQPLSTLSYFTQNSVSVSICHRWTEAEFQQQIRYTQLHLSIFLSIAFAFFQGILLYSALFVWMSSLNHSYLGNWLSFSQMGCFHQSLTAC